jgi:anti-anti-sigma factor
VVSAKRLQHRRAPLIQVPTFGRLANPVLRSGERVLRVLLDGSHRLQLPRPRLALHTGSVGFVAPPRADCQHIDTRRIPSHSSGNKRVVPPRDHHAVEEPGPDRSSPPSWALVRLTRGHVSSSRLDRSDGGTGDQQRLRDSSSSRSRRALEVTHATVGFRHVVSVRGDVDIATVATFHSAVEELLQSNARNIWIDLGEVRLFESSAVRVLLEAHRWAGHGHRRLAIICPRGPVRSELESTGLDRDLRIFDDRVHAHLLT